MVAYTDGSAHPNPGPGGFGVVFIDDKNNILETYSKGCSNTTNNAEEMKAIIYAAARSALIGEPATIYSDSSYAINTFSSWMHNWKKNNWLKSDGKIPENLELVKAFYELNEKYSITLIKVKGHNGNKYNEIADKLATSC